MSLRNIFCLFLAAFVCCFAFVQVSFAQEAAEGSEMNSGEPEVSFVEKAADSPVDAAINADDAVAVTDNSAPAATDNSDNSVDAGNSSQETASLSGDLVTISAVEYEEDHVGARVGTDIGFGLLYSGTMAGLTLVSILIGYDTKSCDHEYTGADRDRCISSHDRMKWSGIIGGGLIGAIAPALAVHTSHAIWGGDGSIQWTYLGGLIGGLAGMGIGACTFALPDIPDIPYIPWMVMTFVGVIGGMVGAIVAYELTNKHNREEKYGTVSRIYPVIEISPERQVFGLGMTF